MIKKSLSGIILFSVLLIKLPFAFAEIIEDDTAKQAFAGKTFIKPEPKKEIIEDDTAANLKSRHLAKPVFKVVLVEDEYLKNDISLKNCTKPAVHHKIIDENAQIIKISLQSINLITTNDGLKLGQKVAFKVSKDVYKDGKIFIKEGTPITAFVELVSQAGRCGDPDEIELGRFSTQDVNQNPIDLDGIIRKQGADRGKWARSLYCIGRSAPYPCAPLMLVYFVKGGKTKIRPNDTFELYYE